MKALLFLLFITSAVAEEKLEVGEMLFEANKMLLSQDFKWEHPLGKIEAKTAEAFFDPLISSTMPQEIVMQEGATITMQDGSCLSAPYAWLGCRQWLGVFHGHEGKKITYEKPSDALYLKSLRMELNFIPPNALLERLIADGSVEIGMDSDMHMTADLAIFDQFSSKGVFGKAEATGSPCVMTQTLQDNLVNKIASEKVELNLREKVAVFYDPEGELQPSSLPLHFKAKKMFVDQLKEQITLDPPVEIGWLGVLETSGHVEIVQKNKLLRSVFIQGPAKLYWKNPQDGQEHRLRVQGTLSVDPVDNKIQMTSPEDKAGIVLEKEQVFFSDNYGQIFADRVFIDYQEVEGKFNPVKMQLVGNVRLQNDTQYALADEAVLEFGKNILTLQSKTRPRVLFYDELNKIQASAPALEINRDPKTGQDVVRGIGNVRFLFAEEELVELKKRFSFETKK